MSNHIEIYGTLKDANFKGVDLSTKGYYCIDFIKSLMPEQEEALISIPKVPGLKQQSKKFKSQTIDVIGFIEGTDYDDLTDKIDELAASLYDDADQQLILSTQNDRYYNAQYLDYKKLEKKSDHAIYSLPFKCNDPFDYAITADNIDEPDTSPPTTITDNDHVWNITNSGKFYAWPIITITFHQSMSHIYLQNNNIINDSFDISKSFVDNDILIIDSKTEIITLNGVHSPAGMGDGGNGLSEFIILKPGINQLQIGTDDSPATIDVDVNVYFRKTYF